MARCVSCMETLANGVQTCHHCGYDNLQTLTLEQNLPPNTILQERYLLGKSLGSGGFGITYVAYDEKLHRRVAIKEFFPSGLVTRQAGGTAISVSGAEQADIFAKAKVSFLTEAQSLAIFSHHKGIVTIYDTFEANGTAYIVMQYLESKTLKDMLKGQKSFSFNDTLALMLPVLDALDAIHAAGIIHRDVAPDNIFVCDDGSVVLIDFGAARTFSMQTARTMTVVLKRGYAPAEQYHQKGSQGPWTDVYAAAATIYRMLTGQVPSEAVQRALSDELQKPSEIGVIVPKHAEDALMTALALKPEHRLHSAAVLKNRLQGQLDVSPCNKTEELNDVEETEVLSGTECAPGARTEKRDFEGIKETEVFINADESKPRKSKNGLLKTLAVAGVIVVVTVVIVAGLGSMGVLNLSFLGFDKPVAGKDYSDDVEDISSGNDNNSITSATAESHAVALVEVSAKQAGNSSGYWLISQDGLWLLEVPATTVANLPTIRDVAVDVVPQMGGTNSDVGITNALSILKGFSADMVAQVRYISAPDQINTTLTLDSNIEIAFGVAEDVAAKESAIKNLLSEHAGNIVYINVRVVDRPTYRTSSTS